MGLFTKDIKTMNDLFVHQLQDTYYAEQELVKALPKMADKATDRELKQGFLTHIEDCISGASMECRCSRPGWRSFRC
jgi:ferritin-like metal-binding protein YciE